jgi:glycyl-tRNA synthetase beta chain
VGAPQAAIDGFLKSAGVNLAQCEEKSDPKGTYYLAVIDRKGRATAEVLSVILSDAINKLPWPKSMRWPQGEDGRDNHGLASSQARGVSNDGSQKQTAHGTEITQASASLDLTGYAPIVSIGKRWVRPLHGIVCTLDGEVIPFQFAGVRSSNATYGHRFLSSGAITVKRFDDYTKMLRDAHVIVDGAERRETILHEAKQKAFALGLEVVDDASLANEVMGLAEWPVVLVGTIDKQFMDLPPEILQTTMRAHQKYFALRDPATLKLANKFVVVANMAAKDGGKEIIAGNERVLRARLADAKFYWDQDRKRTLESRVADLEGIVFHAKLGTQLERVKRIEALAAEIARTIGLKEKEIERAKRAAFLCKADLTTGVVGEFPELQGTMGRYYALADDEDREVAEAIRDHYKPLGPNDQVPTEPISIVVALADKLDTLASFFVIDEKPTGSSDQYGLRRAALGTIRMVLLNNVRISLTRASVHTFANISSIMDAQNASKFTDDLAPTLVKFGQGKQVQEIFDDLAQRARSDETKRKWVARFINGIKQLREFFVDRLKVVLREKGVRHDLIDAVFALGNEDDLVRLVRCVEALQVFLKSDDGANLLTGYKRAANILKIEEKKDKQKYEPVDQTLFVQDEEKALSQAFISAKRAAGKALHDEDFGSAMVALAKLRMPVDRFFEKVTVNVEDKMLRANRLGLLNALVETAHQVADFSKIEG